MSLTAASAAKFQSILNAAFDSYSEKTGIDLNSHPSADKLQNCHSSEDVLQLLLERETEFNDYRGKYRKLIDCFRPIVQVIHAFSGVLGEAADLSPFKPTKAIFVGVDVLLSAASDVSASYDALVELFQSVANFLKRLYIYTEKIPLSPTVSDIAVKIMVEVLSVLALATKQINQGRLKKFAKKLLRKRDAEAILERLDRLTQEEARVIAAHTLGVVQEVSDNLKVVMDDKVSNEIEKMKRDQLQEKIRYWLSPPDPSTNHNIARRDHHDGTATWFTQGHTFEQWKAVGSLLWIHGKPGSGKSILCSSIIQQLKDLRDMGSALMGYFYCDFRNLQKQDVSELLASLVAQFSAKSDACYNVLSSLYSEYDSGSQRPSDDALTDCLESMFRVEGQPTVYIIVDAIDECPNTGGVKSPRERVLELVEKLVGLHLPNVRICAISRPEADISSSLASPASHTVSLHDEDGQKKDIADYVRSVVYSDKRIRKWRKEDKEMVIDVLSRKANGMFRWIVCQLEALKRSLPSTIHIVLDDLPESLDETYDRILLGITRERREYARRLLQCLAVSIRPLRVEELADILAIRFDAESLPKYSAHWHPENSEEDLLLVCSSLITIVDVDGSRVVQFSHFSVQEYLSSKRLADAGQHLSQYHIHPHSAHTILALASLSILLALDDQVDKDRMKDFPLANYAARYWIDHALFENVSPSIKDAMERLFDPARPHFATWVWVYDIDNPFQDSMFTARPTPPEAVPLYYATLCGLREPVEHLIYTCPQDVNARGGYHGTPLHAAIAKRNVNAMQLLLAHGADVTALDDAESTPLHDASRGGHLTMTELLLDRNVDVNARDNVGRTPLHLASRGGELGVAGALLQHGASPDSRNVGDRTPLHIASMNGHPDVVQMLLRSGASVDSKIDIGRTALQLASHNGHLDVVRLLLQNGAAVDSQDNDGSTALHLASHHGHMDVVDLLLWSGAVAGTQDNDGWTPLRSACREGDLDVVRLLIQSGAAVDPQDNDGWTPLHSTSSDGLLDVARFLLQSGAVVDTQDNDGWTPLGLASHHGHLDFARLLLQSGAVVDTQAKGGWTPLHSASHDGHLDVARLLLQSGAVVGTQDNIGCTSLHFASHNGHLDVVRLLLQSGATIESKKNDSFTPSSDSSPNNLCFSTPTPLHLASASGHLNIAQLLVSSGADPNTQDQDENTPLDLALKHGKRDLAEFLVRHMGNVDPQQGLNLTTLSTISQDSLPDAAQPPPGLTAVGNLPGKMKTSLHAASEEGNVGVVISLIDDGADINERTTDHTTPLYFAARAGEVEVTKLLIEHGANVNSQDRGGRAPLHIAAEGGHFDVVHLLLDHSADVNARSRSQDTALHLASKYGHFEIVKLLLEQGANINVQNDQRRTPSQLASRKGWRKIVRLLSEYSTPGM